MRRNWLKFMSWDGSYFAVPCGPTATYGIEPTNQRHMCALSGNGPKGEPNTDPAELVAELESSAAGCRWMLEEWAKLRKRAEKNYWFGPDRLRAIRLLGDNLIDVVDDRRVAVSSLQAMVSYTVRESAFEICVPIWTIQAIKQVDRSSEDAMARLRPTENKARAGGC